MIGLGEYILEVILYKTLACFSTREQLLSQISVKLMYF